MIRPSQSKSARAGLSLVEVLVVAAIIGILAALMFPAVAKSKARAVRTTCAGNFRQWGVAITMYAGDNKNTFPDNRDGAGLSWCGNTVQTFWTNYLVPLVKSSDALDKRFQVLFCPTEKWHRAANLLTNTGYSSQLSVGYYYLPARDPSLPLNQNHSFNYDVVGLSGWVTKRQLGGEFINAPIAMDQKGGTGRIGAGSVDWFGVLGLGDTPTKKLPYSNHVQASGEPEGGNFLYEDGSVRWFGNEKIEPAATADNWVFFYKAPAH
jgi:prepilin-type N-terminal cleavage/methylation domain-containing protein